MKQTIFCLASAEDAQTMFDTPEKVELDGRMLYIDYSGNPRLCRPHNVASSNDPINIDVVKDNCDSNSTGLPIVSDQNTSGRITQIF